MQAVNLTAPYIADVAELADALDSKSSARKGVWVRFPPSVPSFLHSLAGSQMPCLDVRVLCSLGHCDDDTDKSVTDLVVYTSASSGCQRFTLIWLLWSRA